MTEMGDCVIRSLFHWVEVQCLDPLNHAFSCLAVPGTAAVARIVVFSSWLCCQCLRCTFVSVWSVLESCMGENASLPPVEQKKFFTLLLNPRVTHNS